MELPGPVDPWVLIARVLRPRGNRGEVIVQLHTSRPERLNRLERVFLRPGPGEPTQATALEGAFEHQARWVVKFAGVDTIAQAEALRGWQVVIPEDERPALPPGEYYLSDLVGCQVVDRRTRESLGRVSYCEEHSGQVLLEVGGESGEPLLIPLVKEICVLIDPAAQRIEVELPEGLRELNQ